ncbi:MAG TPA: hypothetical protein VMI34_16300 [Candidatus Bathyarchaeia archaeon]|nr:hypothetical protein [Candidatus Bathyarchaeia archaeon]
MARAQAEAIMNFVVVLYLVTHGVSVPAAGRGDLVSGFYLSLRAWIGGIVDRVSAVVRPAAPPARA